MAQMCNCRGCTAQAGRVEPRDLAVAVLFVVLLLVAAL